MIQSFKITFINIKVKLVIFLYFFWSFFKITRDISERTLIIVAQESRGFEINLPSYIIYIFNSNFYDINLSLSNFESKYELTLATTSLYSNATNVHIIIPVPSDATKPIVRTSMGTATYAPEQDSLIWKIRSFPGDKVRNGL